MDDLEYKILRKFHRPKKVDIRDVEKYVNEFPCLLKKKIVFNNAIDTYSPVIKLTEMGYGLYINERNRRSLLRRLFCKLNIFQGI